MKSSKVHGPRPIPVHSLYLTAEINTLPGLTHETPTYAVSSDTPS